VKSIGARCTKEGSGASSASARPTLWRAVLWLHGGLVALLCLHILLILFWGGYQTHILGIPVWGFDLAPPVIALSLLILARYPLRRRRLRLDAFAGHEAIALLTFALIVYLSNGSVQAIGDTLPARYLPLSLLREGNFDLDEFDFLYRETAPPYFLSHVGGHYVSNYPVGAALLALPVYVPSALGYVAANSWFVEQIEKLAAALIVALSAALIFLVARQLGSHGLAVVVAIVYALGSSSLSTSSQALWQHGASQLTITASLYCLVRGRDRLGWVALAGFPLAFSVICRPADALLVLPIGLYALIYHPRSFPGFLACGLPPVAFHVWYTWAYFGDPLHTQFSLADAGNWSTPIWTGLAGILFSPARGLFVYSPVFILSILGAATAWRRGGDPLLRAVSLGVVLSIALYSRWIMWWGGHSYGPRLLADLSPALALLLCPLERWLARPWARALLGVLLAWSIFAHGAGAFWQDGRWNGVPNIDHYPSRLWSWTDNPLANTMIDLSARVAAALHIRPTSGSKPALVVPSYEITQGPPAVTRPGKAIALTVRATNKGKAIWTSSADRGQIMLGWRWVAQFQPAPPPSVLPLSHDVFPRRSYEFPLVLSAPLEKGVYALEIGLVSMTRKRVAWIASDPRDQLRFDVTVEPPRPARITSLLGPASISSPVPPRDGAPSPEAVIMLNRSQFAIGTDLTLDVEVINPLGSPKRGLYIGALLPDGRSAVLHGSGEDDCTRSS
jgi:hypothetical protein